VAIVAIIAVVAIVLAGGDDSKESAGTTTPSSAAPDQTTETGDTTTGIDAGPAIETEPFAELLPRATKYASLAISIDRLIVRAQDPASFDAGVAAEPDGPRWAYIEGSATNPLAQIPVVIESTDFTLVLVDGTELPGGQFNDDSAVAPGATVALNIAFELGDVTDLSNSVVRIGDDGDEPSTIALDGDPIEPDQDRDVAFATGVATVADVDGNTVDWGLGESSTGLDSYYDGSDLSGGQSSADRRAAVGLRWINMSLTLSAGACECDGIGADTSMISLVVDGTPIAPSNTFAEYLAPSTSVEEGLIFEYPATATTATLLIGPPDSPELQQSVEVTLG
jgi:hypothetical protein